MDNNNIWIEKYRPQKLEEIVGQDDIINTIKERIDNLPHMILEGNAGTGKTTTAQAISHELDSDFMELNSSEERGIDTVRGKIMSYVKHLSFHHAPYKILFLDEADNMTPDSQMALRPLMEKHSHNCRFIFGCNYVDKIIKPLISRCKVYRFRPIDTDSIIKRLKYIAEKENIYTSIADKDYIEIAERCRGDIRKAINDLQMGEYGHTEVEQIFTTL